MIRIPSNDLPRYLSEHCQFQQEPVLVLQDDERWQLAFQATEVGFPFQNYLAIVGNQNEPTSLGMNDWVNILRQSGVGCVKLDLRAGT